MKRILVFSICSVFLFSGVVVAGEGPYQPNPQVMSRLDDLVQKIEKMQEMIAEQQTIIQSQGNEIRELRQNQVEGVGEEAARSGAIPGLDEKTPQWLDDLNFGGNLRLRYEAIDVSAGEQLKGVRDQTRFRYQLRFGFTKKLYEDLKMGFWLASGSSAAGTSTNDTFDTDFSKKLIWIERVYMTYTPQVIDGLEITLGKFENPLVTTDIIWDADVRPEGAYESYQFSLFDGRLRPFVTLGQWILQEDALGAPGDAELFAFQGGFQWRALDHFMRGRPLDVKLASTYYDFSDYTDAFVTAGGNPVLSNGNLAAQDFNIADLYLEAGFTPLALLGREVPVKVFTHLAKNFNGDSVTTATSTEEGQDYAYSYGVSLGSLEKPGDWKLGGRYSYIAPNAVAGGLADADFGGANRRGYELAFAYRLRDNLDLEFTGNFSGNVTGVDTEQRMFHTDLKMKF